MILELVARFRRSCWAKITWRRELFLCFWLCCAKTCEPAQGDIPDDGTTVLVVGTSGSSEHGGGVRREVRHCLLC